MAELGRMLPNAGAGGQTPVVHATDPYYHLTYDHITPVARRLRFYRALQRGRQKRRLLPVLIIAEPTTIFWLSYVLQLLFFSSFTRLDSRLLLLTEEDLFELQMWMHSYFVCVLIGNIGVVCQSQQ